MIDDGVAGIIVTIMLIPQALAYALLAELPIEMGLYASLLPLFLYAIFGASHAMSVGSIAVVSLMTATALMIAVSQTKHLLGIEASGSTLIKYKIPKLLVMPLNKASPIFIVIFTTLISVLFSLDQHGVAVVGNIP